MEHYCTSINIIIKTTKGISICGTGSRDMQTPIMEGTARTVERHLIEQIENIQLLQIYNTNKGTIQKGTKTKETNNYHEKAVKTK